MAIYIFFYLVRRFYATLVRFIPAGPYALPGSSRFNNRKPGARLAFDLCSKASPWKYLRGNVAVGKYLAGGGASRLDVKSAREEFYRVRTV